MRYLPAAPHDSSDSELVRVLVAASGEMVVATHECFYVWDAHGVVCKHVQHWPAPDFFDVALCDAGIVALYCEGDHAVLL